MANRFRTTARATLAIAAISLAAASTLAAQAMATLDVSSSRLRYSGDTAASGAFTISPAFRAAAPNASLDAGGGLSQFAGGGWTAQGLLAGAAFTPWRPVVGELAGTTGGSVHADGNRTGQSLASVRLHVLRAGVGAWLGGSLGETWDSLGWHRVRGTEGGVWAQHAGVTATLSVTPTHVADSISFTDAQVSLRALVDRADLTATIGRRGGDESAFGGGAQGWINASVALWLGRTFALTASGGRYPSDPLQGYRPATYGEIGLRLGVRDFTEPRASASTPDRALVPAASRSLSVLARAEQETERRVSAFDLTTTSGVQRMIRIHAPSAQRVEIIGDFTGWQPVPLMAASEAGWWTVTLPIPAGTSETNIRVDGGAWLVPPGLTSLADEDGGVVGVLSVQNP